MDRMDRTDRWTDLSSILASPSLSVAWPSSDLMRREKRREEDRGDKEGEVRTGKV